LILGPDGAKLSKRHGNKYGFPIFAMNWTDPAKNEFTEGFKERGFLPQAFINLLALMGWNPGTEQEIFTKEELIEAFSLERVHSAGAQFDFEKAKWFNQEWIKKATVETLLPLVSAKLQENSIAVEEERLSTIIPMVKDRCQLLNDFVQQSAYFFQDPPKPELELIKPKWDSNKAAFFEGWLEKLQANYSDNPAALETEFKEMASAAQLKVGELQLPLRIMLVGGKFGPPVFEIIALIGLEATRRRVNKALSGLS
jgi:glutamyl-tRNA synthetase